MSNVFRYSFPALLSLLLSVGAATAQSKGGQQQQRTLTDKWSGTLELSSGLGIVLQLAARQQNK